MCPFALIAPCIYFGESCTYGETATPTCNEGREISGAVGRANPVRALLFAKNPLTQVQFSLDDSAIWQNMQPQGSGPVWIGFWDAATSTPGSHIIKVRAVGATTILDQVEVFVNPELHIGDSDRDGDIDDIDLATFINDIQAEVIIDFATAFGHTRIRGEHQPPDVGTM